MQTKDISYEVGGRKLTGYYAADNKHSGKRPGVLVCHQGGGLRDHEKERAHKLAELGYAAFAYDVYGEIARSREQAMELLNGLMSNPKLWAERMLAGLSQLKAQAEVDAIGGYRFLFRRCKRVGVDPHNIRSGMCGFVPPGSDRIAGKR